MKGQDRFKRLYILGSKQIKMTLLGLRPDALKGRYCGPRVLMNSIPKSGTNLLESALGVFPMLRRAGGRTLMAWGSVDAMALKKVADIKKGQFAAAHLPAFPEVISLVEREGIKSLCMIRDPRDVVVSHFKYVNSIDLTHILHRHYASLPDDDARLLCSIRGVPGMHASTRDVLVNYEGWLTHPGTLIVRFEDLIGGAGGGDDSAQMSVMRKIAGHLGIRVTEDELKEICSNTYSTKGPTFRSGKTGGWRKYFKDEHKKAFKELAADLLIVYGYEKDADW